MITRTHISLLAAASVLMFALAGCAAGADTSSDSDTNTGSATEESSEAPQESPGFTGVILSGSGDYTVPDQAPIGGYELPEYQDGLPDGCTWQTYEDENVLGDGVSNGQFVFLTDVTTRFVTDGCPDWVQFE